MVLGNMHVIACIAGEKRVIGLEGAVPWDIETDHRFFRAKTNGSVVVMGRKTHESIIARNGQSLRNRVSIVMSGGDEKSFPGCIQAFSRDDVLAIIHKRFEGSKVHIIGGQKIFELFIPFAAALTLTHVTFDGGDPEGDAFFPPYEHLFRQDRATKIYRDGPYGIQFIDYVRK